jgi:hypothetical protein
LEACTAKARRKADMAEQALLDAEAAVRGWLKASEEVRDQLAAGEGRRIE